MEMSVEMEEKIEDEMQIGGLENVVDVSERGDVGVKNF